MDLFNNTDQREWERIVADGARQMTKAELLWLIDAVKRYKPPGFDQHVMGVRRRYKGDGVDYVAQAIKKRFPKTHAMIQAKALNFTKFIAAMDAGVYRVAPQRDIVDVVDGTPIDDEARKAAFAKLLEGANLDGKAPEFERRVIAAKNLWVLPQWVRGLQGKPGHLKLELFWPDSVGVVCHQSDPGNLDMAVLLLAEIPSRAGVAMATKWYSLWAREAIEDANGDVADFTPWRVHLLSSEGEYTVPPDDPRTLYVDGAGKALPLPWQLLRVGDPEGYVYVDEDRDLMPVVDDLNASICRDDLIADMQGFTPIVYAGAEKKAGEIAWGVGEVVDIGAGETLQPLTLDPKLEDAREGRKLKMKELAITRRNRPSAYATETAELSGIAKEIDDQPHEALLEELAHTFRLFEQNDLLPAMVRTHDAFSGNPPIGPCAFRVMTRKPARVEDPEAKQRRLQADVDAGLITPADMAVQLGHYPNIEAAKGKGVSDELKKKAAPPPMFGFGAPAAPDPLADPAKPADPTTTPDQPPPADQVKP